MKNLLKNHENIIYILIIVGVSFVTSLSAYAATTYEYNSADVWYNNSTSHLSSSNVKGALDELHSTATNYTDITTRTNALYNRISGSNVRFESANLGINAPSNSVPWINFFNSSGSTIGGTIYSDSTSNGLTIKANSSSGTSGQGYLRYDDLSINGSPVEVKDVGAILHETDTVSVSSGNYTDCVDIDLGEGKWLVSYSLAYASNATGRREVRFSDKDSSTAGNDYITGSTVMTSMSASGNKTQINGVALVTKTNYGTKTYYLKGYQNSGTSLNVEAHIYAVRIK